MPTEPEKFVLRTTMTSPFGFKCRLVVEVLGLGGRVTVESADVASETDSLRKQNPLGKIPCLVRGDGTGVFDSGVILECLQQAAGTDRLMPAGGPERIRKFTAARLVDGLMDAGALTIYEGKWHPPGTESKEWLAYQFGKIKRALGALEAMTFNPDPRQSDAATIGLAAALEFLDRRIPIEWRPGHPRLVAWYEAYTKNLPAFEKIRPPRA